MNPSDPPKLLLMVEDAEAACAIVQALTSHYGALCAPIDAGTHPIETVNLEAVDLVLGEITEEGELKKLETLLAHRCDLPVVYLVSEDHLDLAMRAIEKGAYDYVVKVGRFAQTVPMIVQKNLETWRTRQENLRLSSQLHQTLRIVQKKNEQLQDVVNQLKTAAGTDPLTRLANRRSFGQAFERSFAECSRQNRDMACMMIDLDGFKALNDSLGHQCGDELLQRMARVLEANCRRSDVAGRFGGDEFILILPETDLAFACKVADRIRQEFQLAVDTIRNRVNMPVAVSLSQGLTTLQTAKPGSPDQMIAYADHALYLAKQAGKNQLAVFEPMSVRAVPAPPKPGAKKTD